MSRVRNLNFVDVFEPFFNNLERNFGRTAFDALNRYFEDYGREYPAINIWSSAEQTIVAAEMPGIDPSAIDLQVSGNVLSIKGERKAPKLAEGQKLVHRERSFSAFSRNVELPYAVNSERVEASYINGVLKITLPRIEEDKPRRITIS